MEAEGLRQRVAVLAVRHSSLRAEKYMRTRARMNLWEATDAHTASRLKAHCCVCAPVAVLWAPQADAESAAREHEAQRAASAEAAAAALASAERALAAESAARQKAEADAAGKGAAAAALEERVLVRF